MIYTRGNCPKKYPCELYLNRPNETNLYIKKKNNIMTKLFRKKLIKIP